MVQGINFVRHGLSCPFLDGGIEIALYSVEPVVFPKFVMLCLQLEHTIMYFVQSLHIRAGYVTKLGNLALMLPSLMKWFDPRVSCHLHHT